MPDTATTILTTPVPVYSRPDQPYHRPDQMDCHESTRLRAAADQARRRYPGPVGECVADYLTWTVNGGWRVDHTSMPARLATDLLRPP